MKNLILMRHVEAQPDDARIADRERVVSGRGLKQLDDLCQHIDKKMEGLQLVLCSNARRTRQTLEGIKKMLPSHVKIMFEDNLYQASEGYLLERIRRIDDSVSTAMVIAHNPGLQRFLSQTTMQDGKTAPVFSTGSVAFFTAAENFWMPTTLRNFHIVEHIAPTG